MDPFVWETQDELAESCRRIINSDKLDELYGLGGTQTT